MLRLIVTLLLVLIAGSCHAALAPVPEPLPIPGNGALGAGGLPAPAGFCSDTLWDDGLAEVSRFDLTQFRYGAIHIGGAATLVVVREFLDPRRVVKAASQQADAIPVLKAHLVKSFQTGVYRYEQASTVLVRRSDAVPLRLFIESHEWCGSAGKSWVNAGEGSRLRVMSYFDGHGDFEQPLDLPRDAMLEDALWIWLRCWDPAALAQQSFALVPTQLEARAQTTVPVPVSIAVQSDVAEVVPAGAFRADRLRLTPRTSPEPEPNDVLRPKAGPVWWEFTMEHAAPRRLLRFRDGSGTEMVLRSVSRTDYWNHHFPADVPPVPR